MMTVNNYPPNFLEFITDLTKDYKITEAQFGVWFITNVHLGHYETMRTTDIFDDYHSQDLEDIIYQAIDGYNEKYPYTITQDYYCKGIHIKGYEKDFYWNDYLSKTEARLATLFWLWAQEMKSIVHGVCTCGDELNGITDPEHCGVCGNCREAKEIIDKE